jgi:hypothetical protein
MNKVLLFAIVLLMAGCKEKFESPAPPVITGYLVVEGVVNNEGGTTNIRLSRTTGLNETGMVYEAGAFVQLEGDNNSFFQLFENGFGNYTTDNLSLDTSLKYRLSIKTSNNEVYLSDFIKIKKNPPIDSISWERDDAGVHIFTNTHDPLNQTLYYQWEFQETWEFHSRYFSTLQYATGPPPNSQITGVEPRSPDDKIFICWQYNSSSSILLGSSAKLSKDIIHLPLLNIPPADIKLSVKYSILVKQYVWSKEGYGFLERMKKNTESVGSVFDAQPSELNGNIHCISNPKQPAIGFFNICTIQQKRTFISNAELPQWKYFPACNGELEIENNADSIATKGAGLMPTYPNKTGPFNSILTFYAADPVCVDCTLRGSNIKPTYWP